MRLLFVFLDGVGLGPGNPASNPFAATPMPNLEDLLGGKKLTHETVQTGSIETARATLLGLDACLGVHGFPQSATGQAVLLTGKNVPAEIGYHYGPKPNPAVAEWIQAGNLFTHLKEANKSAALLNAYPEGYFDGIESGRRLYSAIPLAVTHAGFALKTEQDYYAGQALAADFTGQGWRTHLKRPDAPTLLPEAAGQRLAELAMGYDFSLFEYWLTDYAGHKQDLPQAASLLETFDQVLGGLLRAWDDRAGLILITSDHGNLEDLTTRRHTDHPVPGLLIGAPENRRAFAHGLHDLTGITPHILDFLSIPH
jgi:hypothetical protein